MLVQTGVRGDRLELLERYRPHFLAMVYVVPFDEATLKRCDELNAACKVYKRTWQDFQRPAVEIALALLTLIPNAPKNRWYESYVRHGKEPSFSKYVEPQLPGAFMPWIDRLKRNPGPERLAQCTGMLVSHMDFWIDPARFANGLHADRVWRLGRGLAGNAQTNLSIHVRARKLNVMQSTELGSGIVRTLKRGDVELIPRGLAGLEGLSQRKGAVAPVIQIGATTTATLRDGWVSQSLLHPGHSSESFEVRGFYFEAHCLDGTALEADETYEWGFHTKREGGRAHAHLATIRMAWGRYAGTLCAGWADLYHVPTTFLADFVQLGQLYLGHRVFHEVAIPTTLHILSNASSPAHEDVVSDCFGCCCCNAPRQVNATNLLTQYRCGHRLNLAVEEERAALALLLQR